MKSGANAVQDRAADRVLWLEDGQFKQLAGLVTDPVCGMRLEPGEALALEWEGQAPYFCSAGCREQLEQHPTE